MPDENKENELRNTGPVASMRAGGWILTLALVGLWIGAGQIWRRSEPKMPIGEVEYRVDINHATERDLLNLPEVGPSLARNILLYRQQHGDFYSLSDFGEVPGVGPQTLKQLEAFLSFKTSETSINDVVAEDSIAQDTAVETILTAQSRERIAP